MWSFPLFVEPLRLHQMPLRVYGTVPMCGVKFCDYIFPDELIADSIERFQSLLDITLTESDMQVDIESLPGISSMGIYVH